MGVDKSRRVNTSVGKIALLMPPRPLQGPQPPRLQHGAAGASLAQVAARSEECHYSLSHPVPLGSASLSPPPPPWSRLDLSSRHTLKATSSASASINLIP